MSLMKKKEVLHRLSWSSVPPGPDVYEEFAPNVHYFCYKLSDNTAYSRRAYEVALAKFVELALHQECSSLPEEIDLSLEHFGVIECAVHRTFYNDPASGGCKDVEDLVRLATTLKQLRDLRDSQEK